MSQYGDVIFTSSTDIKHIFGVDLMITQWINDGIHMGNIQIQMIVYLPDGSQYPLFFQYPSAPIDFSVPGYAFQVTYADMSRIDLHVVAPDPIALKWLCAGDYVCVQTSDGIYNTQAECQAACYPPPPPPPPPGTSLVLTADKQNIAVGEAVIFTASVDQPDGTVINLYQQLPLGTDFLIGSGTLQGGYCTISHTFTRSGTEVQYACTPGLIFTCDLQSNLVPIVIATEWKTWALYGGLALAAIYILGKVIDKGKGSGSMPTINLVR